MVKGPRGVNREGCRPKVHFDPQRLKARKGTRTREIVVQKEEEEQHQEALTELIWYQIDVKALGGKRLTSVTSISSECPR